MLRYHTIPVTAYQQNCTIVWDDASKQAVIIDAGGDSDKLLAFIAEHNLQLTAIWLTHGHLDHIGASGEIAVLFNIPIIGPHHADGFWVDALGQQAAMFGFKQPAAVVVTQWLNDGDTLQLGNYQFKVWHTPGHTPGHVVIYSPELAHVWTGDVLFAGSIGRTDFPQGNHADLIHSIHSKLFCLPDDTTFSCGHGPQSTIGVEKRTNPLCKLT